MGYWLKNVDEMLRKFGKLDGGWGETTEKNITNGINDRKKTIIEDKRRHINNG